MADTELDHLIIHVDDVEASNNFYVHVLGAQLVDNPEGRANPLGAYAYRVGAQQINVHGPWPGRSIPCCPPPFDGIGTADLAFRTTRTTDENIAWLRGHGVEIIDGPIEHFGRQGWGTSIYCRDPSGNGIELIAYQATAS